MTPDARLAIRKQISDVLRIASVLSSDAHFHCWQENELTVRADEVYAAAQRAAWALERMERKEVTDLDLGQDVA